LTSQIDQRLSVLTVATAGPGFTDITRQVAGWLTDAGAGDGLLTLFMRHTSASLVIQENADPTVREDLVDAFDRLAPRDAGYRHDTEGSDDMPAHIKTALSGVNLSIPVARGRMLLGTWQGIYVFEHRDRPHRREVALHFLGTINGERQA
jgi:secondary thiamine-phosphate synthase enzyme